MGACFVCAHHGVGWLVDCMVACLIDWFDVHWLVACLVSLVWLIAWCCVLGRLITVLWETVCLLHVLQGGYLWVSWFCVRRHRGSQRATFGVQGKVAVRQAGNGLVCPKGLVILYDIKWYYDQHNADPVASHKFLHSLGFSDAVATIQCTTSVVWRCLKRRS